jgi:hypothetical protein
MNKLVCGIILIGVLCSCQQKQEEQKQNTTLPQKLEFVVPTGGEDCDHPDCGSPMIYDGCFMFDSAETVAFIRLNEIVGIYEADESCRSEVAPFHSGLTQAKISDYFYISGREVDFSNDTILVSGLCFRNTLAWDNSQMVLVSLAGNIENRYVTRCIPVRDDNNIISPTSNDDIIDLPSNIDELASYLDGYFRGYDVLCPPKVYDSEEQQRLFDSMLECSTFQEPGRLPDPPCVDGSEEDVEACLEALQE